MPNHVPFLSFIRMIMLIVCLFTLTVAPEAGAAVTNTTTDTAYPTLDEAYAAAAEGDVLVLDDGIYDVPGGLSLTRNVTIKAANVGQAVLNRHGLGPVISVESDATVEGLRLTGGSIGIQLRDVGEVTGNFSDITIHNMTIGIAHDNTGGTAGAINVSYLTMYSVARAIVVNDGGRVTVSNAIFARIVCPDCETFVAQVSGSHEGPGTITIENYLLDDVTLFNNSPSLVTATNEVPGNAAFADLASHNYALLEGAVGEGTLGARYPAAPRHRLVVRGNGEVIDDGDSTPSITDLTDFGEVHGGGVHPFVLENEGFSETVNLTGGGDKVQLGGEHASQFSVLMQPSIDAIAPLESDGFELYYAPTTVGSHEAVVIIPNDSNDNSPYNFSIAGTNINEPPVAVDDVASVDEDEVLVVSPLQNDSDADDDLLNISAATLVSGEGLVEHDEVQVTFTPATDFFGSAKIDYTVDDSLEQAVATINVTVNPVNDAPVAEAATATTDEDVAVVLAVLVNVTDIENDALQVIHATLLSGQGTTDITPAEVTYTPAENYNGAALVQYTVSDGDLSTDGTVSVTVQAVNDAPVALPDVGAALEEQSASYDVLNNDLDVDGDDLTLIQAVLTTGQGTVIIVNNQVEYTSATDYTGEAIVTYSVSDGELIDSSTLTLQVRGENDPPVAQDDTTVTDEDTPIVVAVLVNDTDIDGDDLFVSAVNLASGEGEVSFSDTEVTYTPATDFNGSASINYTVSDGLATDTAILSITVNAVDDAPVAMDDAASTDEDSFVTVNVIENDTDVELQTLTVTSASLLLGEGEVSFDDTTITYTPALNFFGAAEILYEVSDGSNADSAVLRVNVRAVNDAPTVNDESATTEEDVPVNIDVLENDTDVDGDVLQLVSVSVASGDASVVFDEGVIGVTPASDFHGQIVVAYGVSDGSETVPGTLTVAVTPVNDAPLAADDVFELDEDNAGTFSPTANDSDVDGDTLTITLAVVESGALDVSVSGNNLVVSPAPDFHGVGLIRYVISDGELTNQAYVSVTVNPVNDAPVVGDLAERVDEDTMLTVDVLAVASDVDGDALALTRVQLLTGPGSAVIVDGMLRYLPEEEASGLVEISYTVSDGHASDTGLLMLDVMPVNDAPELGDDSFILDENEAALLNVLANDRDAENELELTSAEVTDGAGAVTVVDGQLQYTPVPWFTGEVTITYTASDGDHEATATTTVTVKPLHPSGTIPISDIDAVNGVPVLQEALSVIPLMLVDGYEESRTQEDDIGTYSLTGQVSLVFPASLNLPEIQIHGADVLVYAEDGMDADGEDHRLNSFFIKISLYQFLSRMFETTAVPQEIIGLIPDIPIIIGYSDTNLDETAIASLPDPVQAFFSGVFDTNFGIPVFDDTGSLNLFLSGLGYDTIPDTIRRPLRNIGIDAQFIEDNLGVGGRLTLAGQVNSLGQILDVLAYLIPSSHPAGFSLTGMPAFEFSIILPGLSLPDWLQSGTSQVLAVQGLNFEPGAAGQIRYFMGMPDFSLDSGELVGLAVEFGIEGLFRINMPNILNADSLRDAPGSEPLDVRGRIQHNFEANLEGDGVEASGGMTGTLSLVNDWINPMGLPGVSIGNAVVQVGGAVSAGAKLSNAGVGIDVNVGLGGDFACLNDDNEPIGSASMAGYAAIKVGASIPIRGFGIAVTQPAMSFVERVKCGVRLQVGTALGMPDTVVALIPDPKAKETIRALHQAASGSVKDLVNDIVEAPLSFAPLGAALDQFRFSETEFYLATPGIELPGHIDGIGFRIAGGAEYRNSRDSSEWVSIGQARFEGNISDGIHGTFNLADYNIADLIIMNDVAANIDLQLLPPTAELGLSGRQKFLDLDSRSEVAMSLQKGILLDSSTSLGKLGSLSVAAKSRGGLEQWPPVEPFDMSGSIKLVADPSFLANQLHAVAGDITGAAADAYRTALNRLSGELEHERNLKREIDRLEDEVREATNRINAELRPRFAYVRDKLYEAERAADYFYNEARWYERSHDARPWWDWGGKAYDWARAQANRVLYDVAKLALPAARHLVNLAEDALNNALYKVTSALEPRLNALRVALGSAQAVKALVFVTVQGLEAANNAARAVSDALRDINSFTIHDASAEITSLNGFLYLNKAADMNLDFELTAIQMRCRTNVDFRLFDPVSTVTSASKNAFGACAKARTDSVGTYARQTARKQMNSFLPTAMVIPDLPPTNDNPDAATAITGDLPLMMDGSTLNATTEEGEYLAGSQTGSIWWQWQPRTSGYYRVTAAGGDTALQIHDASLIDSGVTSSLMAADTRPVFPGELVFEFSADKVYLIAVTSQLTDPGRVTLIIENYFNDGLAPTNDHFVNAVNLTSASGTDAARNLNATIEAGEQTGDSLPLHNTLWWRFTAPATAIYSFDTLTSDVDTVLRAYKLVPMVDSSTGEVTLPDISGVMPESLPWLETSDSVGEDPSGLVSVRLYEGETLWISAGSRFASVGTVALNWRTHDLPADLWWSDHLATAELLSLVEGSTVFNNLGATTEPGEPLHGGVANHASIWFELLVPQSGSYILDTRGSEFDTVMALYQGSGMHDLVLVAGNDDAETLETHSRLRVNLEPGTPYRLAIAGKTAGEGELTLNVTFAPSNDDFEDQSLLAASGDINVDYTDAGLQTDEPDYAEILAADQSADDLVESFNAALSAAGDDESAPPPPELLTLQELAQSLYDDTLENLRANPVSRTLWWQYVPAVDGDLLVSSLSAEVDTVLVVFSGSELGSLTPLAWNDDAGGGLGSELRLAVTAGQHYFISLGARAPGATSLAWQLIPEVEQVVANDHPDDAVPLFADIGSPIGVQQANVYARKDFAGAMTQIEAPDRAVSHQAGKRLWWTVTAEQSGWVTLDTLGSGVDTIVEVYQLGADDSLVLRTLNDDFQPDNTASRVRLKLETGQSIYVAVDSVAETAGRLALNVLLEAVPSVSSQAGDLFTAAEVLSGSPVVRLVDTSFIQFQTGEPRLGAVERPNLLWYRWQAPASGELSLRTAGSDFDTVLALFEGEVDSALADISRLDSNDDVDAADKTSAISYLVEGGRTYYIGIAGKRGVQGMLRLSLTFEESLVSALPANSVIGSASKIEDISMGVTGVMEHINAESDPGSPLVVVQDATASSRWYTWTAVEDGRYTVSTQGSEAAIQLEVYRGENADSIVLLASDNNSAGNGRFSTVEISALTGQQFYIRLTSAFAEQGAFLVSIERTGEVGTNPETVVLESADAGVVPARITTSGDWRWVWEAPRDGQVLVSLSGTDAEVQLLEIYGIGGDEAVLLPDLDITLPAGASRRGLESRFEATAGEKYEFRVTAVGPVTGNSTLGFSYQGGPVVSLEDESISQGVETVTSLINDQINEILNGTVDAVVLESAVLDALQPLITANGAEAENVELRLDRSGDRITLTVTDSVERQVLLSLEFDHGAASAGADLRHQQVPVGGMEFTTAGYAGGDANPLPVAIRLPLTAFNQNVRQAFISVAQWPVAGLPGLADSLTRFQSTHLYDINLRVFNGSARMVDLDGANAVDGVGVRVPVDTAALLAWLNDADLTTEQARSRLEAAFRDDRLRIVTAETPADMAAGRYGTLEGAGDVTVNLTEGYIEFTTRHFSTFAMMESPPAPLPPPSSGDGPSDPIGEDDGGDDVEDDVEDETDETDETGDDVDDIGDAGEGSDDDPSEDDNEGDGPIGDDGQDDVDEDTDTGDNPDDTPDETGDSGDSSPPPVTGGRSSGGGGGGCSMGTGEQGVDPTLPLLLVLSIIFLWTRHRQTVTNG